MSFELQMPQVWSCPTVLALPLGSDLTAKEPFAWCGDGVLNLEGADSAGQEAVRFMDTNLWGKSSLSVKGLGGRNIPPVKARTHTLPFHSPHGQTSCRICVSSLQ